MEKEKIETITASGMKERGWTDKLIRDYYPTPYATKKNPVYASASPMKFYSINEVERIENLPEYKAKLDKLKEGKQKRQAAASKAVETKTKSTLEIVKSTKIGVIKIKNKYLLRDAIDAYNDFNCERGRFESIASKNSDKEFLDRIVVNYVRHNLTEYDYTLYQLVAKTGKSKAYVLLNEKIYSAIAEVYPHLKHECDRQLQEKLNINNSL